MITHRLNEAAPVIVELKRGICQNQDFMSNLLKTLALAYLCDEFLPASWNWVPDPPTSVIQGLVVHDQPPARLCLVRCDFERQRQHKTTGFCLA